MNTDVLLDMSPCPCGSGRSLQGCCLPIVNGIRPADTAEALMRSRYTAYVIGNVAYLSASWHASTRPARLDLHSGVKWLGLRVVSCKAGRVGDLKGQVEFIARYSQQDIPGHAHENSRFVNEEGIWFYLDGDLKSAKAGARNESCGCGSGKKYKKCCGQ